MGLDLLRLEMDTLWGPELYGRSREHPLAAMAVAEDGEEIRFAPSASEEIRAEFRRLGMAAFEVIQRDKPGGGPSYVFASDLPVISAGELRVVTSDEERPKGLPSSLEPWWEADEWSDLLGGRIGPWAMGLLDDRIVSICHTPAAGPLAAEAGTWTHPDYRGRGWAAAVTAAWAGVASREFGTLFYSTSFDNLASQSVARKLGLRKIGEIWQVLNA